MRSQSTSCGMVRWSVSKPSRGRHAATRSASAAQVPASGRSPTAAASRPAGHEQLAPGAPGGRVALDRPVRHGVADQPGPGVDPGQRLAGRRLRAERLPEHRPVGGHVGDLDAQHEAHRLQPGHERGRRARLDRDPGRLAVVDEVQRVLDVPLGRQHERLARGARLQPEQVLGGHRVQPAQPVGAGDRSRPRGATGRPRPAPRRAGAARAPGRRSAQATPASAPWPSTAPWRASRTDVVVEVVMGWPSGSRWRGRHPWW